MSVKVERVILATVGEFKKYWEDKGPFKYAICSLEFPDIQLEPEEWLFSDDSTAILKAMMKWDEKKMKVVHAPFSKKKTDAFRPENTSEWKINNFPEEWIDWKCRSFTPAGHITTDVIEGAAGATKESVEEAFFKSLEETVTDIGYMLFRPSPKTGFADLEEYLREWQKDEDEDGRF